MPTKDYLRTANNYAKAIVSGKIPASYYLNLQCQMYLSDLVRAKNKKNKYRWTMSRKHANHVCSFFEQALKHVTTNEHFGKPFFLFPFQVFFLVNVFGWREGNDIQTRRYQNVILFIPRKNGKTTLISGLALYELFCGDMGAQILIASTVLQQAEIAYGASMEMLDQMPKPFISAARITQRKAVVKSRNSKYTPLSNNPKTKDGLNPSLVLFDEAAAIMDHKVFTVLKSGTLARRNSLQIYATTAQTTQTSYFYEQLKMARENLDAFQEGGKVKERRFSMLYYLDDHEDWTDPKLWAKANPALGKALYLDSFESQFEDALSIVSERIEFKTKALNIWEKASESWIDMQEWAKCAVPEREMMRAGDLYVAVDMAISRDLACVGTMYVRKGKRYYDYQCFYPEKSLSKLSATTRSIFELAVKTGKIRLTKKSTIDQEEVIKYIVGLNRDKKTKMKGIGFDPAHSQNVQNRLADYDIEAIGIQQAAMALSAPTEELDRLIGNAEISILDCPFLKWQAENCVKNEYKNKNIKIEKPKNKPENKIDAIVCMIMAVSMVSMPATLVQMDIAGFSEATTTKKRKRA